MEEEEEGREVTVLVIGNVYAYFIRVWITMAVGVVLGRNISC